MKQKIFFLLLFLAGIIVGSFYLRDFLHYQHPSFGNSLSEKLWLFLALAVIIQLGAHFLRAYKSRLLINNIRQAGTTTLFKGLSVGFLFNTLLPFRIGELIRAVYIGDALYISKTAVFVSIIIERIIDGFILGLCFISAGLLFKDSSSSFTTLTHIGVGVLILSAVLSLLIYALHSENKIILKLVHTLSGMFNQSISNRLRFMAWSGIYGTKLMLSNKKALRKYFLLSLVMWVAYFASTVVVALAFFHGLDAAKAWYTTQSSYAGVSAPAGPGYIGTFHLIVTQLLDSVHLSSASVFASLIWLVMVVPISLIGLGVLIKQRIGGQQELPTEHMLINKLYREKNVSQELSHFLDAYFQGEKINQILTHAELEDKFKLIKSFRGGSNAHTMLVWQNQEMRVKKISLLQYSDKLEDQAEWLISHQDLPNLPKVVHQEKNDHYYYFDLAYHEEFFPLFDYIHSHSASDGFSVLKKVVSFLEKSVYKERPARNGQKNLENYIDQKVVSKVNDTAALSKQINDLAKYPNIIVNGQKYLNVLQVVEKIKSSKKIMQELSSYNETPIHGDLTVDNLIVSEEGDFLLLDPNNENQVSSKVVDFGKLYQSLHSGYEFLIQLQKCELKENLINFEDSKSHKYAEISRLFDASLKKQLAPKDYRGILFHEAVHYCRMLTYRVNINEETVPIFYATAVKLFNEFLAQYDR
ncbi:hypothetical protein COU91_02820 [Candidatus Saccharibacteria bacterium CG10_big_fil_rev_8_21_14_0_10_47_8]|nr:MAG: hypothetical protein COU91_02820 [Candidatus Saccharibacteria bacterium CG10_big_fil_rev_8_21_14_0_10_47_8]